MIIVTFRFNRNCYLTEGTCIRTFLISKNVHVSATSISNVLPCPYTMPLYLLCCLPITDVLLSLFCRSGRSLVISCPTWGNWGKENLERFCWCRQRWGPAGSLNLLDIPILSNRKIIKLLHDTSSCAASLNWSSIWLNVIWCISPISVCCVYTCRECVVMREVSQWLWRPSPLRRWRTLTSSCRRWNWWRGSPIPTLLAYLVSLQPYWVMSHSICVLCMFTCAWQILYCLLSKPSSLYNIVS